MRQNLVPPEQGSASSVLGPNKKSEVSQRHLRNESPKAVLKNFDGQPLPTKQDKTCSIQAFILTTLFDLH
eukprot:1189444-Amphidinium_carterae.1